MPDLNQVSEELFEDKLEELLDYYRYDNDVPEIDEILSGVTRMSKEQFDSLETSELYTFIIDLLSQGNDKCINSMIIPQKIEILRRVIDLLVDLSAINIEIFIFGSGLLMNTYHLFGLGPDDLDRFKIYESDNWKKINDMQKTFL